MNELKQGKLRGDLLKEVKRYIGYAYAEDFHNDYISVNEQTYEIGYRNRGDSNRQDRVEYYNVLDLIKGDGITFEPNLKSIEAVVQTHLPSPNVKMKFDEWIEIIKDFLIKEQPTTLHPCRFCIGVYSASLCCLANEDETIEEESNEISVEDIENFEEGSLIPMRKAISRTSTGYKISGFEITKILIDFINPE